MKYYGIFEELTVFRDHGSSIRDTRAIPYLFESKEHAEQHMSDFFIGSGEIKEFTVYKKGKRNEAGI